MTKTTSKSPQSDPQLDKALLLRLYREMLRNAWLRNLIAGLLVEDEIRCQRISIPARRPLLLACVQPK